MVILLDTKMTFKKTSFLLALFGFPSGFLRGQTVNA
jgi:hypothetical protein